MNNMDHMRISGTEPRQWSIAKKVVLDTSWGKKSLNISSMDHLRMTIRKE